MTDRPSPEPPCVIELRQLREIIMERISGRQASSLGHKGRNVSYAEVSLKDQIAYYRGLLANCPTAAAAGLTDIPPVDAPIGRGGPARYGVSRRV